MRPDPEFFISDPPVDPGPFFDTIDRAVNGMRELSIILASQELGIFNFCSKARDIRDLAQLTATDAALLAHACDALVSVGFLTKRGSVYQNTPVASLYLTEDSLYSQIHYIRELAGTSGISGFPSLTSSDTDRSGTNRSSFFVTIPCRRWLIMPFPGACRQQSGQSVRCQVFPGLKR